MMTAVESEINDADQLDDRTNYYSVSVAVVYVAVGLVVLAVGTVVAVVVGALIASVTDHTIFHVHQ